MGCQIFVIMVNDLDEEDPMRKTLDHLILQEYADVFPSEIPGMPLKTSILALIRFLEWSLSLKLLII